VSDAIPWREPTPEEKRDYERRRKMSAEELLADWGGPRPPFANGWNDLGARERRMAKYLATGMSVAAIAEETRYATSAINFVIARLMSTTNSRTKGELMTWIAQYRPHRFTSN
jgi:DNA-binding NarL/FixJ family response regulator